MFAIVQELVQHHGIIHDLDHKAIRDTNIIHIDIIIEEVEAIVEVIVEIEVQAEVTVEIGRKKDTIKKSIVFQIVEVVVVVQIKIRKKKKIRKRKKEVNQTNQQNQQKRKVKNLSLRLKNHCLIHHHTPHNQRHAQHHLIIHIHTLLLLKRRKNKELRVRLSNWVNLKLIVDLKTLHSNITFIIKLNKNCIFFNSLD
jgi:hypothetical protein